eukprot:1362594-Rhodomonas_salina.2
MLGLLLRGMRPLVLLFCLACSAGAFSPLSFSPKQLFVSRLSGMRKTNTPLRFQQKALRAPLQSRGVQCSATSDETLQHVPVVDFHGFVTGNAQEKEKVALQIFRAFNDIGFVTLVNHGLEPEVLKQTFRSSRDFFELPDDAKQKYKYRGAESNRGYLRLGHEKLADGLSDIKETFEIGNEAGSLLPLPGRDRVSECLACGGVAFVQGHDARVARLTCSFVVVMGCPVMNATSRCFDGLDEVHLNIMRCVAIGLKLDPGQSTVRRSDGQTDRRTDGQTNGR